MKQRTFLLIISVHFMYLSPVRCIDFGIPKVVGTFTSGVAEAAKVPASAISAITSIPGKVLPGSGSTSTPKSSELPESTTTTSSIPTAIAVNTDITSEATTVQTPAAETNNTIVANLTNAEEGGNATSGSSSWIPPIPNAIKNPIDVVAGIPNTVASTAGGAWNTVSETVVSQDPVTSVKFYFYDDPSNLTNYKLIVPGQPDSLKSIRIAPDSRLNILIHGFRQDINSSFHQNLKDAILTHTGAPVICVDWGHMADGKFGPDVIKTLLYPFIVDNVEPVGEHVGDFIVFLKNNSVITDYDQVHIAGFSLGAHVSGIAGWTVQNRTGGEKIGRITGLDPAGPKFFLKTKERRLHEDDAKFVDVIHTSHLGYFLSMGHIDFFPNGGKIQPGCVETDSGIPDAVISLGSLLTGSCSHARAWQYYTKSFNDSDLFGCECDQIFKYEITGCEAKCEDKVPFGESTPSSERGNYYLSI